MISSTECYCFHVTDLDDVLFDRAVNIIPWQDRKNRIGRYFHKKDKLLSLGAGLLLYHLLDRNNISDKRLITGTYGKYELAVPKGLHFNISHSGEYAVCVLSHFPVGIDIEAVGKPDMAIAKNCFSAEELNLLERSDDPEIVFFRLWTLKESYIKMIGRGLSIPLNSFSVILCDSIDMDSDNYTFVKPTADTVPEDPALPNDVSFKEFRLPGYCISVCFCGGSCSDLTRIYPEQITGLIK